MNSEIEFALNFLGAEPLAGSGFEDEQPEPDFDSSAPVANEEPQP